MTLVSEVMNRSLVAVAADASMADAVGLVRRTGAEHVLVVDEQVLVGILCACDLRGARAEDPVAANMLSASMIVRPDVDVEEAAVALAGCSTGCLPVAVGGLLLGTVSEVELRDAGVEEPRPRCPQVHRRGPRKPGS